MISGIESTRLILRRPAYPLLNSDHSVPPVVHRVVHAGVQAPSAGNSQPWRFHWNGKGLEIHMIPGRALSFLNFFNVDTWLSLGAVLENMTIQAKSLGYDLRVPEHFSSSPVATVRLVPGTKTDHPLADAVCERHTNRRPYHVEDLPESVQKKLSEAVSSEPAVALGWVQERRELNRVADALGTFDRALFEHPKVHDSVLRWIRWNAEEAERGDGLVLPSLEMDPFSLLGARLGKTTQTAALLGRLGVGKMAAGTSRKLIRRSAAIGFIFVDRLDPEALVQAGTRMERLWLTATRLGWSLHPVAGLILLHLRCRFGGGEGISEKDRRWIEASARSIGRVIPAFERRIPVIAFRLGRASAPTALSSRRLLEETFTF